MDAFTPDYRDKRILDGLADGEPLRSIATALNVSPDYARKLIERMRLRMAAKDNAHAVAIAYDLEILLPRRGAS
jgi:DNA-binding CsgD family transcriptional regulator